jgi:hypothetical protein
MVPPNRQLTFKGLHGVISQKIELIYKSVVLGMKASLMRGTDPCRV